MQIDKPTEEIMPCECGYKPDHYTIGYGRHPYQIWCFGCKKSLNGGDGMPDGIIAAWNNKFRQQKRRGEYINLEASNEKS